MNVRPATHDDLAAVLDMVTTEGLKQISSEVLQFPSFTGLVGDKPVVCAGVMIQWPGLGIAWAIVSEKATRSLGLFKHVKIGLMKIAMKHKLHRVETTINLASPLVYQFRNFAEHLGFEFESHMPYYGQDRETYIKMVWFPPEQFYVR